MNDSLPAVFVHVVDDQLNMNHEQDALKLLQDGGATFPCDDR